MCLKTLASLTSKLDNRTVSANELQRLKLQLAGKLDFYLLPNIWKCFVQFSLK